MTPRFIVVQEAAPGRERFVSAKGSARSYTDKLQYARTFATREEAQADCCGNESVVPIEAWLQPPS